MNCLKCGEEFKPKHKYHQFCSKACKFKNYFCKERQETNKIKAPKYMKIDKIHFDWKDYPNGV